MTLGDKDLSGQESCDSHDDRLHVWFITTREESRVVVLILEMIMRIRRRDPQEWI